MTVESQSDIYDPVRDAEIRRPVEIDNRSVSRVGYCDSSALRALASDLGLSVMMETRASGMQHEVVGFLCLSRAMLSVPQKTLRFLFRRAQRYRSADR